MRVFVTVLKDLVRQLFTAPDALPGPEAAGAVPAHAIAVGVARLENDVDGHAADRLRAALAGLPAGVVRGLEHSFAVTWQGDRFGALGDAHRQVSVHLARAGVELVLWGDVDGITGRVGLRVSHDAVTLPGFAPLGGLRLDLRPDDDGVRLAVLALGAAVADEADRPQRLAWLGDAVAMGLASAPGGQGRDQALMLAGWVLSEHGRFDGAAHLAARAERMLAAGRDDPLAGSAIAALRAALLTHHLAHDAEDRAAAVAVAAWDQAYDLLKLMPSAGTARAMCRLGRGRARRYLAAGHDDPGMLLAAQQDVRKAIGALDPVAHAPAWAEAMAELGRCLIKQGEMSGARECYVQALTVFEGAIRVMPKSANPHRFAEMVYAQAGVRLELAQRDGHLEMARAAKQAYHIAALDFEDLGAQGAARGARGGAFRAETLIENLGRTGQGLGESVGS